MCSNYTNHSRFSCEHNWEGLSDHLKRKWIFALTSYDFCISISILEHVPWQSAICNCLSDEAIPDLIQRSNCLWSCKCAQYGHISYSNSIVDGFDQTYQDSPEVYMSEIMLLLLLRAKSSVPCLVGKVSPHQLHFHNVSTTTCKWIIHFPQFFQNYINGVRSASVDLL